MTQAEEGTHAAGPPTLPALPLEEWEPTRDTLHLYAQIIGKIRLASTPRRNHWWHVPLYVGARGLTTGRMQQGGTSFEIDVDVLDHAVVVRTSDGGVRRLPLHDGLSVAAFYTGLMAILEDLGVPVRIRAVPFGIPVTTPFAQDTEHAAYDGDAVRRYWQALVWVDGVLQEFAGWFCGKTSPVHLFWHSFDLALTRFSDRRVPGAPGADAVTRDAYSHEVVSFGFWPGDARTRHAAFYSYTAPEPPGLTQGALQPGQAAWTPGPTGSLALLAYDDVRSSAAPRDTLLAFLQSAYDAGAQAAGWDRDDLSTSWCPAPERLLDRLTLPPR